jgi:thiol:disulfide interchange protein
VRLFIRLLFGLSGFLLLAAAVYLLMSHGGKNRDLAGPALMGIAAVAFGYVGLVLRAAARRAERAAGQGAPAATLVHVPPTIWPFAFSIAALALVVGLVVATRILVPLGLALFAGSAVGWFADVRRAHHPG